MFLLTHKEAPCPGPLYVLNVFYASASLFHSIHKGAEVDGPRSSKGGNPNYKTDSRWRADLNQVEEVDHCTCRNIYSHQRARQLGAWLVRGGRWARVMMIGLIIDWPRIWFAIVTHLVSSLAVCYSIFSRQDIGNGQ